MGWLSALGESWGQSQPRWQQQRELDRKWQMQQAQEVRDAEDFKTRQRASLAAILRDEALLRRQPTLDKQADELFELDLTGKRAGIRRDTLGADAAEYGLGRDRAAGTREDQFFKWMQENPNVTPEQALMAAARFGVDNTKTAGLQSKLNTDLQREQLRSNAAMRAAELRALYSPGNQRMMQDWEDSPVQKSMRNQAGQQLMRLPQTLQDFMDIRNAEAGKLDTPEAQQQYLSSAGADWERLQNKRDRLTTQASPDTIMGGGIGAAEGMSSGFAQMNRNLMAHVQAKGPQQVIDEIADSPELNPDEKEMLRQQAIQLGAIFGQEIDPDYRPKVYREPYGGPTQRPAFGIGGKYGIPR